MNFLDETYVIQEGDTLFKIAEEKCGDGELKYELAWKNGIKDIDMIEIGQKIVISCKGNNSVVTVVLKVDAS